MCITITDSSHEKRRGRSAISDKKRDGRIAGQRERDDEREHSASISEQGPPRDAQPACSSSPLSVSFLSSRSLSLRDRLLRKSL